MSKEIPVTAKAFEAIQNIDTGRLSALSERELRPILSCLVRMSLCSPLDTSDKWGERRKEILRCLAGIETVNSLVGLLSIDFHALEQDAKKEQQLRAKTGGQQTESTFISQLTQGVALEFEHSDAARKLRLLLSELLFVMHQMNEPDRENYWKDSELLDSDVYLEELSDVLCIAQAELPSLLPIAEVAEALLHLPNGTWLLCRLVANAPDAFHKVCCSLVTNSVESEEEGLGGLKRVEALRRLCNLCPAHALTVRALCVEHCKLASLTVAHTLAQCDSDDTPEGSISDVVAFVSGLLLGSDMCVRKWFAAFVKNGQNSKDPSSMLALLRQELVRQLRCLLATGDNTISETRVVQGCAFMRLYCALKGIASMKFNDDENRLLLQLATCHPPPTAAGVRFICLALSMLLACPYILETPEQERDAITWIRWLVQEVRHFERASGVQASFGQMLLLIAIHFHSNQNNAIANLVCSTLGMKSAVKANALTKMKAIFVHEIFTEQVVSSHAVNVAVTEKLSADITGYLPIHCVYQLLCSRTFSKYKVPIKNWIYRQICNSATPIHNLMTPLIESYVNSVVVPTAKTDRTNEPISEREILVVFRHSMLAIGAGSDDGMEVEGEGSSLTTQLLLLYYVLLYQDTMLTKTPVASSRTVVSYSGHLLAQLPIKYLLQQAQRQQQLYEGLFPGLLRLLATHYPHLCLVEDCLDEELSALALPPAVVCRPGKLSCTVNNLQQALCLLSERTSLAVLLLQQLNMLTPVDMLPYAQTIVSCLPSLLPPSDGSSQVPRRLLQLVHDIWLKLHVLMPRRLRVMTVNALRPTERAFNAHVNTLRPSGGGRSATVYSEDDLTLDPLIVLQCDERVFRCAPLLELTLRVLEGFLQASRSHLAAHLQETLKAENGSQSSGATSHDREEQRNALIAAQESCAVQILLESCLPASHADKEDDGLLCDLRQIQGIICSHLHQMFIANPCLVKLVHFQCYPSALLPATVAGIPSMHICLDFIPELISQPNLGKQIFAVQLVSHLSLQYALPKSLSIAKLAVSVMSTLLTVMSNETRPHFFLATLPALPRISQAFPPLCEDIVLLLLQLGRVCTSYLTSIANVPATDIVSSQTMLCPELPARKVGHRDEDLLSGLSLYTQLSNTIQHTFLQIVNSTAVLRHQLH